MDTETGISECKAEQQAAILTYPKKDEEGRCKGAEDSTSSGQKHRDSLEVQPQRADDGVQNGGSLGHEHEDSLASVGLAVDHEAAYGRAGS